MPVSPDRVTLAKKRILSVLRKRLYANIRQLESKIAEAGPTDQRCDPHIITQALKELIKANQIKQEVGPFQANFYYLPDPGGIFTRLIVEARSARKQKIHALCNLHHSLTSGDSTICGDALEAVIATAIKQSAIYVEMGSKKNPVCNFGDVSIPGPFDFLLIASRPQGTLVCVEAKNIREWIYPDSRELWALIYKCSLIAQTGATVLPVLICRKIPYYARLAFKRLGVLGFEMHRQYYIPAVEAQLTDLKHKDGLGFHDITIEQTPPDALVRFLINTVPDQAKVYTDQFRSNLSIFEAHAKALGDKNFSAAARKSNWLKLKNDLDLFQHFEQYE